MNRKRIARILIAAVVIYFILMFLLYLVEHLYGGSDSQIKSVGDAAWYIIATLTTVGYGDVTPVTGLGKVVGAVLMVSSAGLLTFLLGIVISLLFGRLLPVFSLWKNKNREWYIFTQLNPRSRFLANRLAAEDKHCLCIFCADPKAFRQEQTEFNNNVIALDENAETILGMRGKKRSAHLFFMTDNGWDNYRDANALLKTTKQKDFTVYCETEYSPERIPDHMVLFDLSDNTARSYWMDSPLEKDEKTIVFIGSGELAFRMLERGLLINVFPDEHHLEYHLFGDWEKFRQEHYELGNVISIDSISATSDSLVYEKDSWRNAQDLIKRADRILICGDCEEENLTVMNELFLYYPLRAKVDIHATLVDERCGMIGDSERVISRENVMKDKLNHTAVTLNDLYREKTGNGCAFNELKTFYRQSNISSADHLLTKIRLLLPDENVTHITSEVCEKAYKKYSLLSEVEKENCRYLEHKRWTRFYVMNNWSYAPERDNSSRRHTMIVPYDKLTREEQILDDSAWEVLEEVAKAWR